jgi:hypothetical protein
MSAETIFQLHLVFGYVAWLLCFGTYILPWLKSMEHGAAQRVIATLHSFRFFGLVFLLPGVVGARLPAEFAVFSAYGDFATGLLAMLALATYRIRPVFWTMVATYNVVGLGDLVMNYYHATQVNLPALSGQLGAMYAIPIIYVPLLFITHVTALGWLVRWPVQVPVPAY